MDVFRNDLSMRYAMATEFVSHDLPRLALINPQSPLEKVPGGRTVPSGLQEHVHDLAILVHRSPQIMLFAADLYENCIDEESIAVTLMLSFQAPGIRGTELDTPEADQFMAGRDSALG